MHALKRGCKPVLDHNRAFFQYQKTFLMFEINGMPVHFLLKISIHSIIPIN